MDLTYAWESMVARAAEMASPAKRLAANQVERNLLRVVSDKMRNYSYQGNKTLSELSASLFSRHRDIVTLNFDRTIDRSLVLRGGQSKRYQSESFKKGPKGRGDLVLYAGDQRIWHPHGIATSGAKPSSIQLGLRAYAQSVQLVNQYIGEFRKRFSAWRNRHGITQQGQLKKSDAERWEMEVRDLHSRGALSWVDVCMTSDIIIVGCSLERVELDIWTLLHERQRQFLRVRKDQRPKTFFLHKEPARRELNSCGYSWLRYLKEHKPAGIIPVGFDDFRDIWRVLMGLS